MNLLEDYFNTISYALPIAVASQGNLSLDNDYQQTGSKGYHNGETHHFRMGHYFNQQVGSISQKTTNKVISSPSGLIESDDRDTLFESSYSLSDTPVFEDTWEYLLSLYYCTHGGAEQFLLEIPHIQEDPSIDKGVHLGRITSFGATLTVDTETSGFSFTPNIEITCQGNDLINWSDSFVTQKTWTTTANRSDFFEIKAGQTTFCYDAFGCVFFNGSNQLQVGVFDTLTNDIIVAATSSLSFSSSAEAWNLPVSGYDCLLFVVKDGSNYSLFSFTYSTFRLTLLLTTTTEIVVRCFLDRTFYLTQGSTIYINSGYDTALIPIYTEPLGLKALFEYQGYLYGVREDEALIKSPNGTEWKLLLLDLDLLFNSAGEGFRGIRIANDVLQYITSNRLYTWDITTGHVERSDPFIEPLTGLYWSTFYRGYWVFKKVNPDAEIVFINMSRYYKLTNPELAQVRIPRAVGDKIVGYISGTGQLWSIEAEVYSANRTIAANHILLYKKASDVWRGTWDLDHGIKLPTTQSLPSGTEREITDNSLDLYAIEYLSDFSVDNSEALVSTNIFGTEDYNSGILSQWAMYILVIDRRYWDNVKGYPQRYLLKGYIGDYKLEESGKVKLQLVSEATNFDRPNEFKTSGSCLHIFGSKECNYSRFGSRQFSAVIKAESAYSTADGFVFLSVYSADSSNDLPDGALQSDYTNGTIYFQSGQNIGVTVPIALTQNHPTDPRTNAKRMVVRLSYPLPYRQVEGQDTQALVSVGCNRSFQRCKELGNNLNYGGFVFVPGAGIVARGSDYSTES